jgi:hypothetical protein
MTRPVSPMRSSPPAAAPVVPSRQPADYVYPVATVLIALLLLFTAAF